MASYKQVSYGSQGDDVKTLQTMLNQNGYKLDVDGIFGSKTQAAVKDYQQKNKLSVDGIVGTNTWGALTKATGSSASSSGSSSSASSSNANTGFTYKDYTESDAVKNSQAALNQHQATKPQDYTPSQYQTIADEALQQYLNRGDFSYDVNADALYQQYKDKYIQQGKMAMMDTVGQASALTGGYGNSYAVTAGNQAYQSHLQNLNDVVPELYQMAYDRYAQEGQDLLNVYGVAADRENQEYSRYQDAVNAWNSERDYLSNQYNAERDYDYGKYADDRSFAYGQYSDDRAYAYQQERDKIADQQWQAQFDEAKRQYDESLAASKAASSGSSGGSGGSGGSGKSSSGNNSGGSNTAPSGFGSGLTSSQIKIAQKFLGVTADGIAGNQTYSAMKSKGYDSLENVLMAAGANDYDKGNNYSEGTGKWTSFDTSSYTNNVKEGNYYSTVVSDLRSMKAKGVSNAEAQKYLKELLDDSLIVPTMYTSLYNSYRDNKL